MSGSGWLNTGHGQDFLRRLKSISDALKDLAESAKVKNAESTERRDLAFEIYKRAIDQRLLMGPVSSHENIHHETLRVLARESYAAADIFIGVSQAKSL